MKKNLGNGKNGYERAVHEPPLQVWEMGWRELGTYQERSENFWIRLADGIARAIRESPLQRILRGRRKMTELTAYQRMLAVSINRVV